MDIVMDTLENKSKARSSRWVPFSTVGFPFLWIGGSVPLLRGCIQKNLI